MYSCIINFRFFKSQFGHLNSYFTALDNGAVCPLCPKVHEYPMDVHIYNFVGHYILYVNELFTVSYSQVVSAFSFPQLINYMCII